MAACGALEILSWHQPPSVVPSSPCRACHANVRSALRTASFVTSWLTARACAMLHQAKDLVYKMLTVDTEKRATLADVLDHPVSVCWKTEKIDVLKPRKSPNTDEA